MGLPFIYFYNLDPILYVPVAVKIDQFNVYSNKQYSWLVIELQILEGSLRLDMLKCCANKNKYFKNNSECQNSVRYINDASQSHRQRVYIYRKNRFEYLDNVGYVNDISQSCRLCVTQRIVNQVLSSSQRGLIRKTRILSKNSFLPIRQNISPLKGDNSVISTN